jgi:hypothetical protein
LCCFRWIDPLRHSLGSSEASLLLLAAATSHLAGGQEEALHPLDWVTRGLRRRQWRRPQTEDPFVIVLIVIIIGAVDPLFIVISTVSITVIVKSVNLLGAEGRQEDVDVWQSG